MTRWDDLPDIETLMGALECSRASDEAREALKNLGVSGAPPSTPTIAFVPWGQYVAANGLGPSASSWLARYLGTSPIVGKHGNIVIMQSYGVDVMAEAAHRDGIRTLRAPGV